MGIRQYYEKRPPPVQEGQWSRLIAGSVGASAVFLILTAPSTVAGCVVAVARGTFFAACILTVDVILWVQLDKARRRRDKQ